MLLIAAIAETAAFALPIRYRRLRYRSSIGARARCELALLMRDGYEARAQAGTIKADLMRRNVCFDAVFRLGRSGRTGVDIGYESGRKNFHQCHR